MHLSTNELSSVWGKRSLLVEDIRGKSHFFLFVSGGLSIQIGRIIDNIQITGIEIKTLKQIFN